MVSLYIYIFFDAKLYSDAGLNVFFLVMQFYGWYQWTRGPVEHARSLARGQAAGAARVGLDDRPASLAGTAVLGTTMHRLTDAALPYPDAFTTLLSVFAQFLLTRKVLDNWMLWIVADVIYIGIYTTQGALLDGGALRRVPGALHQGLSGVETIWKLGNWEIGKSVNLTFPNFQISTSPHYPAASPQRRCSERRRRSGARCRAGRSRSLRRDRRCRARRGSLRG